VYYSTVTKQFLKTLNLAVQHLRTFLFKSIAQALIWPWISFTAEQQAYPREGERSQFKKRPSRSHLVFSGWQLLPDLSLFQNFKAELNTGFDSLRKS